MQNPNGVGQSGLKPPIQIPQSPIQNPNPPSKSPNPQSKIQIPHPNPPSKSPTRPNPPSKSASSIPATCGRKLGTDFRRQILLENELRFPAPCRGNRGSISGETILARSCCSNRYRSTLRGADHVCLIANIAWHRPCYVQTQETSTSHGIVDYPQSLIQCNILHAGIKTKHWTSCSSLLAFLSLLKLIAWVFDHAEK